jgi:phage FluMu gp28-like protein
MKNLSRKHCGGLSRAANKGAKRDKEKKPSPSSFPLPSSRETSVIHFRPYQEPVFWDKETGILVLHWSRQIGKSFTLAAWAVDRLLKIPGRLVVALSNSRDNGGEFVQKCHEVCRLMNVAAEIEDMSIDQSFDNMRMEVRIKIEAMVGRIKVLAANPRTARGFSGDLILDEFAFHENSTAIWEAAEPILSSNPDFLCRIASTGNGRHNMFYRMATGAYKLSRVPRTLAWQQGVKVYDPATRQPITPEEARAKSLDKRAYDQNYECAFADENMTLLSHELISAAEREGVGEICPQDWSASALALLRKASGPLFVGCDVGRNRDLSVMTVAEKLGDIFFVRGILRLEGMRLPQQQLRLGEICRMPNFRRACIDMTGLGIGLVEYAQDAFGMSKIIGINFASTVPMTRKIAADGRKRETVRVTEAMAVELLAAYEDRRIQHPIEAALRDSLRKPEKITTPGGRVSIAATRDDAGHADEFWSFALALEAGRNSPGPFAYRAMHPKGWQNRLRISL